VSCALPLIRVAREPLSRETVNPHYFDIISINYRSVRVCWRFLWVAGVALRSVERC
jgi:hypothetical protein